MEMHRRLLVRHLDVAIFENGFWKSARRHLYITGIKDFLKRLFQAKLTLYNSYLMLHKAAIASASNINNFEVIW